MKVINRAEIIDLQCNYIEPTIVIHVQNHVSALITK